MKETKDSGSRCAMKIKGFRGERRGQGGEERKRVQKKGKTQKTLATEKTPLALKGAERGGDKSRPYFLWSKRESPQRVPREARKKRKRGRERKPWTQFTRKRKH